MNASFRPSDGATPNMTSVPSCMDVVAGGAGGYLGPRGVGLFRTSFRSPAAGSAVRLQFQSCSFYCRVWVNGREVGDHLAGGYVAFALDVPADALSPDGGGENELFVLAGALASPDTSALQPPDTPPSPRWRIPLALPQSTAPHAAGASPRALRASSRRCLIKAARSQTTASTRPRRRCTRGATFGTTAGSRARSSCARAAAAADGVSPHRRPRVGARSSCTLCRRRDRSCGGRTFCRRRRRWRRSSPTARRRRWTSPSC